MVDNMIKCLTIFSSSYPNKIIISGWMMNFVETLKNMNIKVYVLTPNTAGALSNEERCNLIISRFEYFYPKKYQCLASNGGLPYNFKRSNLAKIQVPIFILSELYHAMKIVHFNNINIINSHWLIPQGFVGAICRKLLRIPHIATLHSSEVTFLRNIPFRRQIAKFIAFNSDIIISVSQHRIDEFISFIPPKYRDKCKQKVRIIPMGINKKLSLIECDINDLRTRYNVKSKHIILYVGRLVEVKGIEYLIESFKKVIVHHNDIVLLIVGSGPLEYDLKTMVVKNDLTQFVRFEGFVDHNKIWDYYKISDIVVVPSIIDSSGYEEGLPVTILEAMCAGIAIIGTKTNGICEVIHDGENGLLVDQKDSEQIAEKIIDLLNNDELRATLSKNAISCANNYSWDVIGQQYLEIISSLTSLESLQEEET